MLQEFTEIRFSPDKDAFIAEDLFQGVHTLVELNRNEKDCLIIITSNDKKQSYKFNTFEIIDFLELDLRFKLNEDENPQNIREFVNEIPIVYGLID